MPTLNLSSLNTLAEAVRDLTDLSEPWSIHLLEAAPRRRGWNCDIDAWLTEHPQAANRLKKITHYQTSELSFIDVLETLPCEVSQQQPNTAIEAGREEACWVVLQALAAHTPILASDELRSWFTMGDEPGIFIEADQPHAVADALRRLINDPLLREHYAKAAGRTAERQFSRSSILETYKTL
ncbi:MAG: hypothetical protein ACI9DF_003243 [Verrucomicrobiales bacterium]